MELLDQDRQYKKQQQFCVAESYCATAVSPAAVGMMIVVTTVVAVKKCPYGGIQSAFCYFPIYVPYYQMESFFATAEPLKYGL